jgi:hypothetical protein
MNAGVPLELLPPITAEMRRVLGVAAAISVLTERQAAAFCFVFRWLDVSRICGRRIYSDFRIQRARLHYLHVSTNRSNA